MNQKESGFTLIELAIVVVIIFVLGSAIASKLYRNNPQPEYPCPPGLHWEYEEGEGWECDS